MPVALYLLYECGADVYKRQVQDAVQFIDSILYTYIYYISIDGSILILYYLYCLSIFQRTCASFSKAGAKVKGFILTAKLFGSFFHFSFSVRFSGSLSERERRDENDKRKTASLCESDCKYKNFIYYNPNFSGSFLFLK